MVQLEYEEKNHRDCVEPVQSRSTIEFLDKYITGLTIIDDQHKCLIEIMNALYRHVLNGQGKTETFPVLAALRHYQGIHHAMEKSILEFCNPQYRALYDLRHEDAVRQLQKVENLLRWDMDPKGMITYLKLWWPHHMDGHGEFFVPLAGSCRIH